MYKHLFKWTVFIITILTANLLTSWISEFFISYKNHYKPLTFTFIAMGIIVVVFYPLFSKMEEFVNKLSKRMLKGGKSLAGKYWGLLLIFFVSMFILTYFYARMWYKIDLFVLIFNGTILQYF